MVRDHENRLHKPQPNCSFSSSLDVRLRLGGLTLARFTANAQIAKTVLGYVPRENRLGLKQFPLLFR